MKIATPLNAFVAIAFITMTLDISSAMAIEAPIPGGGEVNDFVTSGTSTASEQVVTPSDSEADGQKKVNDPWEGYNRQIYSFNNGFDKIIARPIAVTYEKITPESVQNCISRFFGNLREPGTAVNQALQGKPLKGLKSAGRFVINTTVGIAGLYDPASYFGISKGNEDFGQTLAVWGWEDSRYFVLPLFGPRTLRDTAGIVGDQPLSPIGYVENGSVMLGLSVMQLTDARVRALPFDEMRSQAIDEYSMVRDAWMDKRTLQITKN